jgi:hypothetical protein
MCTSKVDQKILEADGVSRAALRVNNHMSVSLSCRYVGLAQQFAENWQSHSRASTYAGETAPQIM